MLASPGPRMMVVERERGPGGPHSAPGPQLNPLTPPGLPHPTEGRPVPASPPRQRRVHSLQLSIPLPDGICWEGKATHTRPGNVSPTRYAEIVRGALLDRFERMTADGERLRRIALHFGIPESKVVDLFYTLQLFLFPEAMEADPEVEAEIVALRAHRDGLVPETGLERCSEEMMQAFLSRVVAAR